MLTASIGGGGSIRICRDGQDGNTIWIHRYFYFIDEQIVAVEASEVSRQQALDVSPVYARKWRRQMRVDPTEHSPRDCTVKMIHCWEYCNFRQRSIRQKDDSLTQAVSAGSAERHLYQVRKGWIYRFIEQASRHSVGISYGMYHFPYPREDEAILCDRSVWNWPVMRGRVDSTIEETWKLRNHARGEGVTERVLHVQLKVYIEKLWICCCTKALSRWERKR